MLPDIVLTSHDGQSCTDRYLIQTDATGRQLAYCDVDIQSVHTCQCSWAISHNATSGSIHQPENVRPVYQTGGCVMIEYLAAPSGAYCLTLS